MKVSVTVDVGEMTRYLNGVQRKQIPFATARALTKAAQQGEKAVRAEMKRVFVGPTPFTLKGLYIQPAKKNNLVAWVWMRGWSPKGGSTEKSLAAEIQGGKRQHKRFEQLLIKRGIMPADMYAVPGKDAKLDKYGNLPRAQVVKMLANLQALHDTYQHSTKKSRSTNRYFYAKIGKVRGIWTRQGAKLKLFVVFVRPPNYRRRLNFEAVASLAAERAFPIEFERSLEIALATAR